jgi:8-oxo-dGTP pyrophosphatase MutT (NUDIX family)
MMDLKDDPRPWDTLSSTYLSRKPWLTLRQDRVRLPNGAVIEDYNILEYPEWVNVLAVTADSDVVLLRQYRPGIQAVHFELPAGVCEADDPDFEASARRELLEETGYGGGEWRHWMSLSANPGTHTNQSHTFLARGVVPLQQQQLEKTEDIRVHVVSLAQAREIVLGGGIKQSLHAAPLLKYLLLGPEADLEP